VQGELPRKAIWQTAVEAAKVVHLSSSGQLQLQAADFGFDDREDFEVEEGASARESSPDSVTISPRLRSGPPNVILNGGSGWLPQQKEQPSSELAAPSNEATGAEVELLVDCEGDDSDCEVASEVRDRRIELDLDLMKAQKARARPARPASSSPPPGNRKNKEHHGKTDCGQTKLASAAPETFTKPECGDEAAERIAADLGLLRKPRGACSVSVAAAAAAVPAPLRQRTQVESEVAKDEEKARRKAARKAAKEAAKQLAAQDQEAAEPTQEQISEEEAKARRRAARKAAKEAAKHLDATRHVGETAGVARDAWAAETEVVGSIGGSKEVSVLP